MEHATADTEKNLTERVRDLYGLDREKIRGVVYSVANRTGRNGMPLNPSKVILSIDDGIAPCWDGGGSATRFWNREIEHRESVGGKLTPKQINELYDETVQRALEDERVSAFNALYGGRLLQFSKENCDLFTKLNQEIVSLNRKVTIGARIGIGTSLVALACTIGHTCASPETFGDYMGYYAALTVLPATAGMIYYLQGMLKNSNHEFPSYLERDRVCYGLSEEIFEDFRKKKKVIED